ncbi:MAG: RNB domain-containing ribonuclease [bacterium]|nr:RNB domain-containing ribonuclease [bacterium]
MPASAAELERPTWLQTKAELQSRPLEFARAYDPFQSHEIDDALSVEDIGGAYSKELRVKIHIPDTSAFVGHKFMDQAVKTGWSKYYDDGRCDPLFPNKVVARTSLERGEPGLGAASTTLAFTVSEGFTDVQDVEFYKSRVICEPLTYKQLAKRLNAEAIEPGCFPEEALILQSAQLLVLNRRMLAGKRPLLTQTNANVGQRTAKDAVAEHMLVYNKTIPIVARGLNSPVLFRNHNIRQFEHSGKTLITELYPDSELFAGLKLGWYGRISTGHSGVGATNYCHASSPLRRIPDALNSANLVAALNEQAVPYPIEYLDEVAIRLAEKIKRGLGITAINPDLESVA